MKGLSIGLTIAIVALAVAASPSFATKKLPCGDYDGAPSHNDCQPLSPAHQARCDKIKASNDAILGLNPDTHSAQYIKLTAKYKQCVFAAH